MVTTINGSDLDDDITLAGDSAYESNGFGGADSIVATGAFGSATVTGGEGNDTFGFDTGTLLAYGNQGEDSVYA